MLDFEYAEDGTQTLVYLLAKEDEAAALEAGVLRYSVCGEPMVVIGSDDWGLYDAGLAFVASL